MVVEDKKTTEEEPKTSNKAQNHWDVASQRIWHETMWKEFADMTKQPIWQKTSKSIMPSNCRFVKCVYLE